MDEPVASKSVNNITPMFEGSATTPGAIGSFIGFSGISPAPMEKFDGEKFGDSHVLDESQVKKLKRLLEEEGAAIEAAKDAAKKRDYYCAQLEKWYNIEGYIWTVNFDKGTIEVGKKR